jgi:peptidoglycan hydrolase CwlO-like protein
MITNILAIEDPIFNWVFDHIPTIGAVIILLFITAWVTGKIGESLSHSRNRLNKVEHDTSELKSDVKSIKKKVSRLDKNVLMIDHKLDKLITYLTSTKQIDKDVIK